MFSRINTAPIAWERHRAFFESHPILAFLSLLSLVCLGCSATAQESSEDEWTIELTVDGWTGRHFINLTSTGAYSFKRVRSGEVQERACGTLAGLQVQELQEDVRSLRDVKDRIRKTWPPFSVDSDYATLEVSWISTDEKVRVQLPRATPSGSTTAPPRFLRELVGRLWSYREAVHGECGPRRQ